MNLIQEKLYSKPSVRILKHSFLNGFIRKSLSFPLYVVVRFFLLFSHQTISLIHLIILLLNLSLNYF
ncbi:hypothetical protein Golax_021703 [Gossypium laxum]|uniref:Uncharacterized protein n=1 Tax=Gossypium laxum TaxID=34288 RepID=A0A7J9ALX3_9ROSI|nr:hypothetical protein [Gossypium laxum]